MQPSGLAVIKEENYCTIIVLGMLMIRFMQLVYLLNYLNRTYKNDQEIKFRSNHW